MSDQPSNQSNKSLMFRILDIVVKVLLVFSAIMAIISLVGLFISPAREFIANCFWWGLLFSFGTASTSTQPTLGQAESGAVTGGTQTVTEIGSGFFISNFISYVILGLIMAAIKRYVLDRRTE